LATAIPDEQSQGLDFVQFGTNSLLTHQFRLVLVERFGTTGFHLSASMRFYKISGQSYIPVPDQEHSISTRKQM